MSFGYSKIQSLTPKRVAIYARYSSDQQRPSSMTIKSESTKMLPSAIFAMVWDRQ